MDTIVNFIKTYGQWLQLPEMSIIDLVEIVIIAFAIYQIIVWIKKDQSMELVERSGCAIGNLSCSRFIPYECYLMDL